MENERFRELLDKYSNGNCTDEEKSWLESAYLKWNDTNSQVFTEDQLMAAQQLMWTKVTAATRPVPVTRLWPRIAVAAAIFISVSAGLLFYFNAAPATSNVEKLARGKDIAPGRNTATLTLANGKTILLDEVAIGTLADQSGIKITKSKDGQLEYSIQDQPLAKDAAIPQNMISTPKGGQYKVLLPDGTSVWLNAASSLSYPATFAGAPKRHVELKGEAYFEVKHNPAQPFVVKTVKQEVEVLGTHFNINAYTDEPSSETTLLEGSVRLNGNTMLKPGEQGQTSGTAVQVAKVDVMTVVDWKNGDFAFVDDDFRTTMRKVARWYDIEVVYDESAPEKLKLGGWISRSKNISSILRLMELTGKVHFKIEGRRVTISK